MGCRSGHKQSSHVWLLDAAKAGAQVITGVHAERVLLQGCKVRNYPWNVARCTHSRKHMQARLRLQRILAYHDSLTKYTLGRRFAAFVTELQGQSDGQCY
jgi:hypothetical protein